MTKALVIYITVARRKDADKIADTLVREKLAACVTIVPEVYSRYWWKGHIEYGKELLIIVKTIPSRYRALERRVRQIHAYTVPEILAIPVALGNPAYLEWMKDSLK